MTTYTFSRETQCAGKHGWRKRGDARRALRQMQTSIGAGDNGRRLTMYECPHCNLWHIGHKPCAEYLATQTRAS